MAGISVLRQTFGNAIAIPLMGTANADVLDMAAWQCRRGGPFGSQTLRRLERMLAASREVEMSRDFLMTCDARRSRAD